MENVDMKDTLNKSIVGLRQTGMLRRSHGRRLLIYQHRRSEHTRDIAAGRSVNLEAEQSRRCSFAS